MEKMKKYVLHFVKKTKYVLIAVFLFAFFRAMNMSSELPYSAAFLYGFLPIFLGGLMGVIIVYFFKYIDKDLKIKKE